MTDTSLKLLHIFPIFADLKPRIYCNIKILTRASWNFEFEMLISILLLYIQVINIAYFVY